MSATPSAAPAFAPGTPFHATNRAGVALAVIVYHYVRDCAGTRFPGIRGISLEAFRTQVRQLAERYEMATVASTLDFLSGAYRPAKSLCLLTFDDGLKDHFRDVYPMLQQAGISGVFFVTSRCLDGHVAAVHKNHHLLAGVEFATYRDAVMSHLDQGELGASVDVQGARLAYPWDSPDVGQFKYLLNYQLDRARRDAILDTIFAEFIGDERTFARDLYLSVDEAREMQRGGMVIGGHSHDHVPLSSLEGSAQHSDISACALKLRAALRDQSQWPFSYPYGHFNDLTIQCVRDAGFSCAFALDGGDNGPLHDPFRVRRIDTKDLVF